MAGKVCLRCKGKILLWVVNKLENKKFVDITQQCFALLTQLNFPINNLNFHWRCRWWDQIQSIFLSLFYFNIFIHFEEWFHCRKLYAHCKNINSTHFFLSEMNVNQTTKILGRVNSDIEAFYYVEFLYEIDNDTHRIKFWPRRTVRGAMKMTWSLALMMAWEVVMSRFI